MRAALLIGTALVLLAGCGRQPQPQPPTMNINLPTGNVQISGSGGNISITTPEGQIHSGPPGAMAGLPDGLPAYPNADAGPGVDISGGAQGQGRILSFHTADAAAQVVAFYNQALTRAGYVIVNQMNMGPTASLTARNGQNQVFNLVATPIATGGTQAQIILGADHH